MPFTVRTITYAGIVKAEQLEATANTSMKQLYEETASKFGCIVSQLRILHPQTGKLLNLNTTCAAHWLELVQDGEILDLLSGFVPIFTTFAAAEAAMPSVGTLAFSVHPRYGTQTLGNYPLVCVTHRMPDCHLGCHLGLDLHRSRLLLRRVAARVPFQLIVGSMRTNMTSKPGARTMSTKLAGPADVNWHVLDLPQGIFFHALYYHNVDFERTDHVVATNTQVEVEAVYEYLSEQALPERNLDVNRWTHKGKLYTLAGHLMSEIYASKGPDLGEFFPVFTKDNVRELYLTTSLRVDHATCFPETFADALLAQNRFWDGLDALDIASGALVKTLQHYPRFEHECQVPYSHHAVVVERKGDMLLKIECDKLFVFEMHCESDCNVSLYSQQSDTGTYCLDIFDGAGFPLKNSWSGCVRFPHAGQEKDCERVTIRYVYELFLPPVSHELQQASLVVRANGVYRSHTQAGCGDV
jgi:hypothetical protein